MAEDLLEAVQVGAKAPGEPVAEVGRDRGVLGTRSPGRYALSDPSQSAWSSSTADVSLWSPIPTAA
jgi:hypothetical protein